MKKRFFTLFPLTHNVHLSKDVGMIPFILYRDYGYDSTLVTFKNESTYPSLDNEVKGLKVAYIKKDKKYKFGKPSIKIIQYIWENARKIDILNLYHTTKETLIYALLYKLRNPSGILYIKLDINIELFEKDMNFLKKKGYSIFFDKILSIASFELDFASDYLLSEYPILEKKIFKLSNGIDDVFIKEREIERYNFQQKENLIITVGRIGSPEKNHELLLDSLTKFDLKEWSVVFIGPIDTTFQQKINAFYQKNPLLANKIHFAGEISNREALYKWYNKAKVFCLTSRWESFGIVLVEALYFGNYIITTDISSAKTLTNNGKIGSIIRDEHDLINVLSNIINGEKNIEPYYNDILNYSEKFIWKNIVEQLHYKLNSINYGEIILM
jgi:glycosyltransferase involved in cell wall biosynthesis